MPSRQQVTRIMRASELRPEQALFHSQDCSHQQLMKSTVASISMLRTVAPTHRTNGSQNKRTQSGDWTLMTPGDKSTNTIASGELAQTTQPRDIGRTACGNCDATAGTRPLEPSQGALPLSSTRGWTHSTYNSPRHST
ncbi:hypothetical protein RB195_026338 [Necator americanus]|uniref:Uncharacterized protein n=1 Tax=Necator americanus TaxID=51031 RepID=A0ABR1EWH1_NECAM